MTVTIASSIKVKPCCLRMLLAKSKYPAVFYAL